MYIPRRFEEKDPATIRDFVRENSFALLVSVKDGLPVATHIPLLLERDGQGREILVGHISKGNEQKYSLTNGAKVLAVFAGPHAYVSPRWYTAMKVPTWNYISVHVYGTVELMEGDALKAAVSRLVNNYEQHMPHPVKMEEIPEKALADDLRGIVGFGIVIDEWQAAYKLSQNRDEASYHRVVEELEKGDAAAKGVAEEMERRGKGLFGGGDGKVGG